MFAGKTLADSKDVTRDLTDCRTDEPKNVDALPTNKLSRSMTGPPVGPIAKIGTSNRTRSVNKRLTEDLASGSPDALIAKLGSINAIRSSYRRHWTTHSPD